jgi:hypothetical protein
MAYPSPPVTIASLRPHGVRPRLAYCNGKREGNWPCHHQAELLIEQFKAEETLRDIERRCRHGLQLATR